MIAKALIHAVNKLTAAAHKGFCGYWKIRELPVPDGVRFPGYMAFDIFEVITWEDGKQDTSCVATFRGCERQYSLAQATVLLLRAEEQQRVVCKVRKRYHLLAELRDVDDMLTVGRVDCETQEKFMVKPLKTEVAA